MYICPHPHTAHHTHMPHFNLLKLVNGRHGLFHPITYICTHARTHIRTLDLPHLSLLKQMN